MTVIFARTFLFAIADGAVASSSALLILAEGQPSATLCNARDGVPVQSDPAGDEGRMILNHGIFRFDQRRSIVDLRSTQATGLGKT